MSTIQATRAWYTRPWARFTRHYLEMVLAMLLGMLFLPLWELAVGGLAETHWLRSTEADLLAMATAMTIPMAAWMVHRGHRTRLTVEMCAAMVAGFVVLLPVLWAGWLGEMGVMMTGHTLMPLFMLGAMLARRREYLHSC